MAITLEDTNLLWGERGQLRKVVALTGHLRLPERDWPRQNVFAQYLGEVVRPEHVVRVLLEVAHRRR